MAFQALDTGTTGVGGPYYDIIQFCKHNPEIFFDQDGVDLLSPSRRKLIQEYQKSWKVLQGFQLHNSSSFEVFRDSRGYLTGGEISSSVRNWLIDSCDCYFSFVTFKNKYWSVKDGVIHVFDIFLEEELKVEVKSEFEGYCRKLFIHLDQQKCQHLMGIECDLHGTLSLVEYESTFLAPKCAGQIEDWDLSPGWVQFPVYVHGPPRDCPLQNFHTTSFEEMAEPSTSGLISPGSQENELDHQLVGVRADDDDMLLTYLNKTEKYRKLLRHIKDSNICLHKTVLCNVDPIYSEHLDKTKDKEELLFDVVDLGNKILFMFDTHSVVFSVTTKEWRVIPRLRLLVNRNFGVNICDKTVVDGKLYMIKEWRRRKLFVYMYEFCEDGVQESEWFYCTTEVDHPEILGFYTECENGREFLAVHYIPSSNNMDFFLDVVEDLLECKSQHPMEIEAVLLTTEIPETEISYDDDTNVALMSKLDRNYTVVSNTLSSKKLCNNFFKKMIEVGREDDNGGKIYSWWYTTSTLKRIIYYIKTGILHVPTIGDVTEMALACNRCFFHRIRDQCICFVMNRGDLWIHNYFDVLKLLDLAENSWERLHKLESSILSHPEIFNGVKLPSWYRSEVGEGGLVVEEKSLKDYATFNNLFWGVDPNNNYRITALEPITLLQMPPVEMHRKNVNVNVIEIFLSADREFLMGIEYDTDEECYNLVQYQYRIERPELFKMVDSQNFCEVVDGPLKHSKICLESTVEFYNLDVNIVENWRWWEGIRCIILTIEQHRYLFMFHHRSVLFNAVTNNWTSSSKLTSNTGIGVCCMTFVQHCHQLYILMSPDEILLIDFTQGKTRGWKDIPRLSTFCTNLSDVIPTLLYSVENDIFVKSTNNKKYKLRLTPKEVFIPW